MASRTTRGGGLARLSLGMGLALVTACNGTTARIPAPTETAAPPATTQVSPSTPPATAVPSVAPSPGRIVHLRPGSAVFAPASGAASATWHLVSLGDSNAKGPSDYPGVYARLLADEQRVQVELKSYTNYQVGVMPIEDWTRFVAADQAVRDDLVSADAVTVLIGFHDVLPALDGACGADWSDAFKACLAEMTASMSADFEALYAELAGLVRDPARVLVNDYGIPGPLYDQWSSDPAWPEIRRAIFEDWRSALEAAATANGLTVIHTYAGMNAPDGKPLIDWSSITEDGTHFNAEGHRIVAEIVLEGDGMNPPKR